MMQAPPKHPTRERLKVPDEATPWKRHFSDFGGKNYLD